MLVQDEIEPKTVYLYNFRGKRDKKHFVFGVKYVFNMLLIITTQTHRCLSDILDFNNDEMNDFTDVGTYATSLAFSDRVKRG